MSEEADTYTIVCNLRKGMIDPGHVKKVQDAVLRSHRATLLATELLGYHVRKCIERRIDIPKFGNGNWAKKAWNLVTKASRQASNRIDDPELVATLDEFMPEAAGAIDSTHIVSNVLQNEANSWSTVATTNVFTHFRKRVEAYVKQCFRLDDVTFDSLTTAEKQGRKKELLCVARDICTFEGDVYTSSEEYHCYIETTRRVWELDLFPWDGYPLEYHAKAKPNEKMHLLLRAMWIMSTAMNKPFALLPLRTRLVPRHILFDAQAFREVLQLGDSAYKKKQAKEARARKKTN